MYVDKHIQKALHIIYRGFRDMVLVRYWLKTIAKEVTQETDVMRERHTG